ncbi:DUF4446 family protein [Actinomadura atramentaria]|uniref:DUF4446 family protein n=1 Tax=Actinomadura atramentaria TaxID=1990 RepID=UPI0003645CCB|nr:DUF4446 family protein [Actinomadura atramentaria]
MLVAVAVAGLVAGVAGLSVAVAAHRRASHVVDECATVLRRQLQFATGTGVDDKALRDLAIVHYDALKEMSGHRSFSLALINAGGDGVVISSIIGRTETRTYAKPVRGGHPVDGLSPEENQALRAARLGKGPIVTMDDPLPDFSVGPDEPVAPPADAPAHRA